MGNRDRRRDIPRFLPTYVIDLLSRNLDGAEYAGHRVERGRHKRALGVVEGTVHRQPISPLVTANAEVFEATSCDGSRLPASTVSGSGNFG
jgi:hypothetical protein